MFTSEDSFVGQLIFDPFAIPGYQLFWVFPEGHDATFLNNLVPALNSVFGELNFAEQRSVIDFNGIAQGCFFLFPEILPTEVTQEQVDLWFEQVANSIPTPA